jgi:hypothetical protein
MKKNAAKVARKFDKLATLAAAMEPEQREKLLAILQSITFPTNG